MRALGAGWAELRYERLSARLPERLLAAISVGPGRREAQLVREILAWLPGECPREQVARPVGAALETYATRGEIERGHGGRYYCVPPHLVEVPDPGGRDQSFRLRGDPAGEAVLLGGLEAAGAGASIGRSVKDEAFPPDRILTVENVKKGGVPGILEPLGLTVISAAALEDSVPSLESLSTPGTGEFLPAEELPLGGVWQRYLPGSSMRSGEWRGVRYWSSLEARIVRWLPGPDLRAERAARIFYLSGDRRLAELGVEQGLLWRLYLDAANSGGGTAYREERTLWVPVAMPASARAWLTALSSHGPRRRGPWLEFELPEDVARRACDVLGDRLGFRSSRGSPPFEEYGNRRNMRRGRRRG